MDTPDAWLYEYSIIRYVPRADRGEFLNIGLVMMNKRKKWLKGKILLDEARLRNLNPHLDLISLSNQCKLFERTDVPSRDIPVEEKYRWLAAEKSAVLRVSPSHPGIIIRDIEKSESVSEVMEEEFERLFKDLVIPL